MIAYFSDSDTEWRESDLLSGLSRLGLDGPTKSQYHCQFKELIALAPEALLI
jgi:hypothetical protein